MSRNIALILAGGSGSRMQSDLPKQFIEILNQPIIYYTIEAFYHHEEIHEIMIAVPMEHMKKMETIVKSFGGEKGIRIISGGSSRQHSAYLGLFEMKSFADDEDIVLIHDGARALVSKEIISENIKQAIITGGAVTAIQSTDTVLKSKDRKTISSVLSREELFQAQTPQSFRFGNIFSAHEKALAEKKEYTDDSSLYIAGQQKPVSIVKGSKHNFKITHKDDLELFQWMIEKRSSDSSKLNQ